MGMLRFSRRKLQGGLRSIKRRLAFRCAPANATISICRTRSRVNPRALPISRSTIGSLAVEPEPHSKHRLGARVGHAVDACQNTVYLFLGFWLLRAVGRSMIDQQIGQGRGNLLALRLRTGVENPKGLDDVREPGG